MDNSGSSRKATHEYGLCHVRVMSVFHKKRLRSYHLQCVLSPSPNQFFPREIFTSSSSINQLIINLFRQSCSHLKWVSEDMTSQITINTTQKQWKIHMDFWKLSNKNIFSLMCAKYRILINTFYQNDSMTNTISVSKVYSSQPFRSSIILINRRKSRIAGAWWGSCTLSCLLIVSNITFFTRELIESVL